MKLRIIINLLFAIAVSIITLLWLTGGNFDYLGTCFIYYLIILIVLFIVALIYKKYFSRLNLVFIVIAVSYSSAAYFIYLYAEHVAFNKTVEIAQTFAELNKKYSMCQDISNIFNGKVSMYGIEKYGGDDKMSFVVMRFLGHKSRLHIYCYGDNKMQIQDLYRYSERTNIIVSDNEYYVCNTKVLNPSYKYFYGKGNLPANIVLKSGTKEMCKKIQDKILKDALK